ncbi:MAG: peptide-methionine (S)-S-oxide reductase [Candidatus Micrarchaeum sp. ARMAN-1]|nr:MAG: peptide-methionine (S)-S-oxide reductase [Candidatus Micrarchaeum sp. ARMAN-1]
MDETKKIYLGAGCFWCTEAVFKLFPGIKKITPGYAGGHTKNPTYKDVCSGTTGHAEVAMIEYLPSEITLEKLLEIYFAMHDPTSKNKQGADIGEQYRSIILYEEDSDKQEIEKYIEKIKPEFDKPILTEVKKLEAFYEAEDYHKDYYENNRFQPYCLFVIGPKLSKIRKEFGIKG